MTAHFMNHLSNDRSSLFFNKPCSCSFVLSPLFPSRSSAVSISHRRLLRPVFCAARNNKKSKNKKPTVRESSLDKDEELDDDAFEALFKQLEEDLKNDKDLNFEDDDLEISEEDFALLESELKEALGMDDDDIEISAETKDSEEGDEVDIDDDEVNPVDDGEDDDEDVESPVELKRWQLRRLASALKAGRRKTSIKSLALELGLDRSIVIELLREPPPELLMISAALPDKPEQPLVIPEPRVVEVVPDQVTGDDNAEPETKAKEPVHVMHSRWSAQKRLKKSQVQTLETVYRRTKRPTNAMISSIVHVTSLPRKKIVKWFEDKRAEDGVPNQRTRYERPVPAPVPDTASL